MSGAREIPEADRMTIHRILHTAAVRVLRREIGGGLAVLADALQDAMAQGGGLTLTNRERYVLGVLLGDSPFLFGGAAFVLKRGEVRYA